MLCIFKGPTPSNLIAGDIQTAVEAEVALTEHTSTVQERQDGLYNFQTRPETMDEIHTRLAAENGVGVPIIQDMLARNVGGLDATAQPIVIGETRRASPRKFRSSPNIVYPDGSLLTLADFPDGFSFGNGVTCNSEVSLKTRTTHEEIQEDGPTIIVEDFSSHILSWVVFPDAQEAVVNARYNILRQLVEG